LSEHNLISLDEVARRAAAGHSAFSPSSSKMWLNCSGSLIPNILAEDECSEEAAEGTVAHKVGERWLKTGKRPKEMIGQTYTVDGWDIEVTEEMVDYVRDYVDYVQELEQTAVEFLTETRVDFSDLTPIPDQGGTADHIAIVEIEDELFNAQGDKAYEIVVTDLKYGKGVRVIAEGNSQGRLYGYGSFLIFRKKYNIVRIRIRIAHPRLTDGFTEETLSIGELLAFAEYVKERAAAAWKWDAPRTPTDEGCQWCKVKGTCPALFLETAEVTSAAFEDDDEFVPRTYTKVEMDAATETLEDDLGEEPFRLRNPQKLSTKALAKILRYRKVVEQFFAAVEAELLDRALSRDEEIPGWKLVRGRANRKWPENIAPIYRKLRSLGLKDSAIFTQEMISPAVAEAKVKAKAGLTKDAAANIINAIAVRPPGTISLVRANDRREALASDTDAFEDDDEFVPRQR
jgi:hypothetical protein